MTLRTRSRGMRTLAWMGEACMCICLYVLLVRLFGDGPAVAWLAPEQMRFFLPCLILFCGMAYETRWDGIVRRKTMEENHTTGNPVDRSAVARPSAPSNDSRSRSSDSVPKESTPMPICEAWQRAREMPHEWIPDPKKDAEYLKLVFQAADEGCVPALAKLSEYAVRRGMLVEAYFWMAIAEKKGYAAARQEMLSIRKKWMLWQCPPEYENVYLDFPEERGSVGRALLAIACGIDVALARQRLRGLAGHGQADACLLTGVPLPQS